MALLPWMCSVDLVGAGADRPNVLFLLTDDQRPDAVHALGNEHLSTPALDRLVEEGTTFTRAITAVPICVASRAEILTGRHGLDNGRGDFGFSRREDAVCWAAAMQSAGYDTCYIGKWHTSGRPSDCGYSRTEALYAGGGSRWPLTHPVDFKGMEVTGYRGWVFQTDDRQFFQERGVGLTPDISEDFADAAIRFIEEPRDAPYFLHVNFTAPHDPLLVPRRFAGRYDPEKLPLPASFAPRHPFDHGNFDGRDERLFHWPRTPDETRRALAAYYAVVSHLDEQIGLILDAVDRAGQRENTLVIFSSDHGLALGSHGLRGKQNMYEHSVGVPLVFRGPEISAGRRVEAQCLLRDLYPTVCELCSVDVPPTVQGKSLRPVLTGEVDQVHQAVFAHFRDSQRMIRTAEWKLVEYPLANHLQLFHLPTDPDELNNRAYDRDARAVVQGLQVRLDAHFAAKSRPAEDEQR